MKMETKMKISNFVKASLSGLKALNWKSSREIRSHKEGEIALSDSEDKFRLVFESANVGKSITLPTGEISVNQALCDMLGYTREELINKKWQDLTPHQEIEDIQRLLDPLLRGDKDTARFMKRYIHKNGSLIWADVSTAIHRNREGKPLFFITTLIDITERRNAEEEVRLAHERLRRFIDSNIIGVIIAGPDGKIVEANDYYLSMIGFTRKECEQNMINWRAITPSEWLPADENALRELKDKGACTPYEKEYERRDGTRISVFLTDTMLPGPDEQIAAFALDITERKEAEDKIRRLNEALEQRIDERTAELRKTIAQLEETNQVFVGRELKMMELKARIAELEKKA